MARPANTDSKREEVLRKATECFRKYGYDKTTLDDIAKSLNLNKASLYYYIKNKDELFLEILLREANAKMDELLENVAFQESAAEKLNYFFTNRVDVYIELIKLNSISRETILQLQNQFFMVYAETIQREHQLANAILKELNVLSDNDAQREELTKLIIEVANAIKHEAVMFGDVLENHSQSLPLVKEKIIRIIHLLIHSNHHI